MYVVEKVCNDLIGSGKARFLGKLGGSLFNLRKVKEVASKNGVGSSFLPLFKFIIRRFHVFHISHIFDDTLGHVYILRFGLISGNMIIGNYSSSYNDSSLAVNGTT